MSRAVSVPVCSSRFLDPATQLFRQYGVCQVLCVAWHEIAGDTRQATSSDGLSRFESRYGCDMTVTWLHPRVTAFSQT